MRGVPYETMLDPVAWRTLRAAIIDRDQGVCQYCGEAGHQIDYLRPLRLGGTHEQANLVCCCQHCRFSLQHSQRVTLHGRRMIVGRMPKRSTAAPSHPHPVPPVTLPNPKRITKPESRLMQKLKARRNGV